MENREEAEDDLIKFLRTRGLDENKIQDMKADKIDSMAILQMEDEPMSKYIPKYGDRLAADFNSHESGEEGKDDDDVIFVRYQNKSKEHTGEGSNLLETTTTVGISVIGGASNLLSTAYEDSNTGAVDDDVAGQSSISPEDVSGLSDIPSNDAVGQLDNSSKDVPGRSDTSSEAVPWPLDSQSLSDAGNAFEIQLHRVAIQKEMIAIFKTPDIVHTPLKCKFVDETGLDSDGVSREAFSAFWVSFFNTSADGEDYRVPSLNSQYGLEEWQAIGRILAKGYIDHRIFPIQLAPAFFEALLFGEQSVSVEDLRESFFLYLSDTDRAAIKAALSGNMEEEDRESFEDILDREGSKSIPTADEVGHVITQLAHKCLIQNGNYAMEAMRGVVQKELSLYFPDSNSISQMYESIKPTQKKVCNLLMANPTTSDENQALKFLKQFIRAQDSEGLANLLRFLTASSTISVSHISVEFKNISGFTRRPIAHTCGPCLELPSTYSSYRDFRSEWQSLLSSGYLKMDIA